MRKLVDRALYEDGPLGLLLAVLLATHFSPLAILTVIGYLLFFDWLLT